MTYRLAAAVSFALASISISGGAQAIARSPQASLDSLFDTIVKPGEPGIAVLIVDSGIVRYGRASGLANLQSKQPLDLDTPIYAASIGKQFTAVAIMRLAEQGKLSLDDPLPKYFPEFASYASKVTLRRMLNHTSGLIDHLDIVHDSVSGWTNANVLKIMREHPALLFEPGERSGYSNTAYVLLSMIVEKISGRRFADYVADEFFKPLDMTRTIVVDGPSKLPASRARGYELVDGKFVSGDYTAFTTGSGGIYTTVNDLLKWEQSFYTNRFISAAMLKEASTPAVRNNGRPTENGMGWLAEFEADGKLANVWYVASFGNFKGFQGMVKRFPDRRFSTIILTNRGDYPWAMQKLIQDRFMR